MPEEQGKNVIFKAKNSQESKNGGEEMALTRSFLKGMNLTDEQVSAIIEANAESIEGIKADRDKFKADAQKVAELEKKLKAYESGDDWKQKFDDEHKAFEDYKKDILNKEKLSKIQTAYKAVLKECGVDEKRIDSIIKVTDFSKLKLNDEGKFEDSEDLTKKIKEEWSGFIVERREDGANVKNPPNNTGTKKMTKDEIMAIKDGKERRAAIAANPELFGLKLSE